MSLCGCVKEGGADCVHDVNGTCINIVFDKSVYDHCLAGAMENVKPNPTVEDISVPVSVSEVNGYS